MLPEDKLTKNDWISLDSKEKKALLLGYRIAKSSSKCEEDFNLITKMSETKEGSLVLSKEHFVDIIKSIDEFYKNDENQYVTVRAAIEIAIMKLKKIDTKTIDEKIKHERSKILWGF